MCGGSFLPPGGTPLHPGNRSTAGSSLGDDRKNVAQLGLRIRSAGLRPWISSGNGASGTTSRKRKKATTLPVTREGVLVWLGKFT